MSSIVFIYGSLKQGSTPVSIAKDGLVKAAFDKTTHSSKGSVCVVGKLHQIQSLAGPLRG